LPDGTPDVVVDALAEAARGVSALGEIADSAAMLAQRPLDDAPGSPGLALFCELRRADQREHMPYGAAVELIETLRALARRRGMTPAEVLHPLRMALTGASSGLPLATVVAVLPREEALERSGDVT